MKTLEFLFRLIFKQQIYFRNKVYIQAAVDQTGSKISSGYIKYIDLSKKVLVLDLKRGSRNVFKIDDIATINRMLDGRFRMWIKQDVS